MWKKGNIRTNFKIFNECIIQYLIRVDWVINNQNIITENEFNLAIDNNIYNLIQLLMGLTDDIKELNVLIEIQ